MDEGWLRVSTVVLLASFPSVGIQASENPEAIAADYHETHDSKNPDYYIFDVETDPLLVKTERFLLLVFRTLVVDPFKQQVFQTRNGFGDVGLLGFRWHGANLSESDEFRLECFPSRRYPNRLPLPLRFFGELVKTERLAKETNRVVACFTDEIIQRLSRLCWKVQDNPRPWDDFNGGGSPEPKPPRPCNQLRFGGYLTCRLLF